MPTWDAEAVVDQARARRLLGQFDELEVTSLEPLSEGWDRTVWLVNERWVFGFPRRAVVVDGVERELAFLPRLAPLLPLAIPVPVFVGTPTDEFPWPFYGSAFLPGRELCDVPLDDDARLGVVMELAGFLRRLHSREVAAAIGAEALPVDPTRRTDMTTRVPMALESLADVERQGLWRPPDNVAGLLDDAARLPPAEPTAVVHGDLHFRHLLVDGGRASAVIDWIDLARADPSVDLMLYWSYVPPSAREAFLAAYGEVSDEQLLRARVVALSINAILALYARDKGVPAIEREALAGLARVAER
jgi:aminoglycoside phosphotransferase (APT) family kinase protein